MNVLIGSALMAPGLAIALHSAAEGAPVPRARETALFTVFEGSRINLYARRIEAEARETLILSEEARPNFRPMQAIKALVSPRGDRIAYMLPYPPSRNSPYGPVFLVDAQGRGKTRLIEQVVDFFWAPDGERILYSIPPSSNWGEEGMPGKAPGYEWRLRDLTSGKEEVIAREGDGFLHLAAWAGRYLVFSESWSLIVFDFEKRRRLKGKDAPFLDVGYLSPSPSGTRSVLIVESADNSACTLYEIAADWRLATKVLAARHHSCGAPVWNTDDEVFYPKSTGPQGRILTGETSESGYYLLLSVYKYNFKTRTDHPVLRSDGKEVYRLQGLLPGRAMIVSNESSRRSLPHILEARRLDGTHPIALHSTIER